VPEETDLTTLTVDGSEHFLAITLPSRESMVYDAALEFLRAHRFSLDPLSRKWWLRDRHKVLNILATHGALLRDNLHAEFTPNFKQNTAHLKTAEIAAAVAEEADGYDVMLGLQAGTAPDAAAVSLAGLRSKQNTYMSVPLVLTMVSNHYPTVYGAPNSWVILLVLVAAGWGLVKWLYGKSAGPAPAKF
jgi:hypothetical protein